MEWKTIISKNFGRKASKRWLTASLDILAVDGGIKQTMLFDHWSVDSEEMNDFLLSAFEKRLIKNRMSTLSVGMDIFLFCVTCEKESDCFKEMKHQFIDVSKKLSSPQLISIEGGCVSETVRVFNKCVQSMAADEEGRHSCLNIDICAGLNPPCLFGLLLGYPCVYWYDISVSDENCLSSVTLHLFQVQGVLKEDFCINGRQKIEMKKDVNHDNHCENGSKRVSSSNCVNQISPSHFHTILSFTVPETVLSAVHHFIHNWFTRWKSSVQWSRMFSDVFLNEQTTEPQAVCL